MKAVDGNENNAKTPRRKDAKVLPLLLLFCLVATPCVAAAPEIDNSGDHSRREMVERAQKYLLSIQKNGSIGETRQTAVTAAFVLASLSSGYLPSDGEYGDSLRAAYDFVLGASSTAFLGGREEPNADHAMASLMLAELLGTPLEGAERRRLYERCELAVEYSQRLQDRGTAAEYHGGWRRNDQTRINDRLLTAWYLMGLRSAELRGLSVFEGNVNSAVEFVRASQELDSGSARGGYGGFSVDAAGLAVPSATAAGLYVLALERGQSDRPVQDDEEPARAAVKWLSRNPPRWYGPNFYETNFFAVRGLYRARDIDGGQAFRAYYSRLVRILRERQEADGSFPFPPGHGAPIVAMGRGYSTAMAILILNVDRGVIPMDK